MVAREHRLTFHCKRCQAELGEVLGPAALRVNGREFQVSRRLDVTCPACGYIAHWYPEPKPAAGKKGLTGGPPGLHNDA